MSRLVGAKPVIEIEKESGASSPALTATSAISARTNSVSA